MYNCQICQDAGFVYAVCADGSVNYGNVVPCLCSRDSIEQARQRKLLEWCELPPASEGMRFDTFRVQPHLQEAYGAALDVVSGELKWLTLTGRTNQGKTHLAVAICHEWLGSGKSARYAYVPLLLDELRRGFDKGDNYDRRFEMFLNVPLLVLDDLGTENSTPWVQEKLDTIVDYRLMHELALVVTANLSLSQLSPRIASRLMRHGQVVAV